MRCLFSLALLPMLGATAMAQTPIRITVPVTTGGGTDVFARGLAGAVGTGLGASSWRTARVRVGPSACSRSLVRALVEGQGATFRPVFGAAMAAATQAEYEAQGKVARMLGLQRAR